MPELEGISTGSHFRSSRGMLGISHAPPGYLALALRFCLDPLMPIQPTFATLHLDLSPKKQCLGRHSYPLIRSPFLRSSSHLGISQ
jgi:hypothetical protein